MGVLLHPSPVHTKEEKLNLNQNDQGHHDGKGRRNLREALRKLRQDTVGNRSLQKSQRSSIPSQSQRILG